MNQPELFLPESPYCQDMAACTLELCGCRWELNGDVFRDLPLLKNEAIITTTPPAPSFSVA